MNRRMVARAVNLRRIVCSATSLVLLALAGCTPSTSPDPALLTTWKAVHLEMEGQPLDSQVAQVIEWSFYASHELTVRTDGMKHPGNYSIDNTVSPRQITIRPAEDNWQDPILYGIFALDRDGLELTLCISQRRFPPAFATRRGYDYVLIKFKRQTPSSTVGAMIPPPAKSDPPAVPPRPPTRRFTRGQEPQSVDPATVAPIEPLRLEGEGIARDWQVIFCSADPSIWDTATDKGPSNFARRVSSAPAELQYVRIRRGSDWVIFGRSRNQLTDLGGDGRYGWEGNNHRDSGAHHLGLFDKSWTGGQRGDICIRVNPWYRGWGFGHIAFVNGVQGYCWDGKPVDPCVFEIAVKQGDLTPLETKKLLQK